MADKDFVDLSRYFELQFRKVLFLRSKVEGEKVSSFEVLDTGEKWCVSHFANRLWKFL